MKRFDFLTDIETLHTYLDCANSAFAVIQMRLGNELATAKELDVGINPQHFIHMSDGLFAVRRELERIADDMQKRIDDEYRYERREDES